MEDPADELIRRALVRRTAPSLRPTFVEDVLKAVAVAERGPRERRATPLRRRLAAAVWLLAAAASVAVLANVEWSSASRSVAWGAGLVLVPLAYSAALWPRRFAAVLALCGGLVPGEARRERRSSQA